MCLVFSVTGKFLNFRTLDNQLLKFKQSGQTKGFLSKNVYEMANSVRKLMIIITVLQKYFIFLEISYLPGILPRCDVWCVITSDGERGGLVVNASDSGSRGRGVRVPLGSNRVVFLNKAHSLPKSTGNTQETVAPSQHD